MIGILSNLTHCNHQRQWTAVDNQPEAADHQEGEDASNNPVAPSGKHEEEEEEAELESINVAVIDLL